MGERRGKRGVLFLVCGPSGAGKDAIIKGAKRRLAGDPRYVFPLRIITRPEGFGGELHIAVTPAQFDRLRRRGDFALFWGSMGHNYAVPVSIEGELAAGRAVVVNVSAQVCGEARARYPGAGIIWISASVELCRRRLLVRGRESAAQIDERLQLIDEPPVDEDIEILTNEGSLEAAVDAFVHMLDERMGGRPIRQAGLSGIASPTGL